MPRQTWISKRAAAFVDEASAHGFVADPTAIATMISSRLADTARKMRITEVSARIYLDEATVREWARDAATSLAHEQPGHSVLDLDPTHTVPMALTGRTLAALGIATDIALNDDAVTDARQNTALITEWAVLIEHHFTDTHTDTEIGASDSDSAAPPTADPAVPAALIHRAARFLTTAVHRLDSGVRPSDNGDGHALARSLDTNIAALIHELD